MRNMAKRVAGSLGCVGGANVQFAVNPADGEVYVIEMNPARVAARRPVSEQGDRLSDCQDRGAAGGRIHAGRNPQ
ncbi:MAG: hypothetical protein U0703_26505 [Anaerolineae bacterium]